MANAWLEQIWPVVMGPSQLARRKVKSVLKQSSEQELIKEAQAKGFHVAKVGPQYVVFRHAIDVKC